MCRSTLGGMDTSCSAALSSIYQDIAVRPKLYSGQSAK